MDPIPTNHFPVSSTYRFRVFERPFLQTTLEKRALDW